MLQAILSGQSALKQELSGKIDKVDQKVDRLDSKLSNKAEGLENKLDKVEKNLTNRIDRLGKQLAYLEDDAPTREEYDNLVGRVDKIEQKVTSAL